MGPQKRIEQNSWSKLNKIRKEEKKKWKEHNLVKKLQKKQLEKATATTVVQESPKHIIVETTTTEETQKVDLLEISTVSIAVPGSILENAQSPELRAYLCGQIARAACVFAIDEVVVFDDYGDETSAKKATLQDSYGLKTLRECCVQMGRILQYMECPQYLRKHFFPIHHHLKYCGIVNPLNAPHHLSKNDVFAYREGVISNKPAKQGKGSLVNVGLLKEAQVDKLLTPGIRCTVKLSLSEEAQSKKIKGVVVSPTEPRRKTGVYWGYQVRLATSLSKVFTQCPYEKEGYDLMIGTSDKGSSVDTFECPTFKHLLIVFGGVQGLEFALENDPDLNVESPTLLFDHYLNTLPEQGSRTVRTEEAVLVSLAALRPKLKPEQKAKYFEYDSIQLKHS